MDKKLAQDTHRFDKSLKDVQDLSKAFGNIARRTEAFAGPRDDYHGKRLPGKVWKKKQARRRMQKRSRKAARP